MPSFQRRFCSDRCSVIPADHQSDIPNLNGVPTFIYHSDFDGRFRKPRLTSYRTLFYGRLDTYPPLGQSLPRSNFQAGRCTRGLRSTLPSQYQMSVPVHSASTRPTPCRPTKRQPGLLSQRPTSEKRRFVNFPNHPPDAGPESGAPRLPLPCLGLAAGPARAMPGVRACVQRVRRG